MSSVAIRVEGISKLFRLGELHARDYRTLRETLTDLAKCSLRLRRGESQHANTSERNNSSLRKDAFWALSDISFEVNQGEVVGVVGRNGAGKSTFLKILSRISAPTRGKIEIRGRIGSLLEVGTGFHPELTGRENIFLNGAILGMTRRQILRDFDSIVDFSEISQFLDTPVKRYSSGMYVRLAFAIASHLDPEVLIVDEVLAVGDAQFQKKCLGRMDEVRRQGRTVLFVSHNLSAVRSLCTRGILLENGRLTLDGDTEAVTQKYLDDGRPKVSSRDIPADAERITNDCGRIRCVAIRDINDLPISHLHFGQPFRVNVECEIFDEVLDGLFEVSISTLDGIHVLIATTIDGGLPPKRLARGHHTLGVVLSNVLLPREYVIDVGIHQSNGETIDYVPRACAMEVLRVGLGCEDDYPWQSVRGHVRAMAQWDPLKS
jgi:lipopolysaccharide transport system ATP-binding protein